MDTLTLVVGVYLLGLVTGVMCFKVVADLDERLKKR